MAVTAYWTNSAYQAALASITSTTTVLDDGAQDDVTTFVDGGLKTGGATNSTVTALWDLGTSSPVTKCDLSWYRMDNSGWILEASNNGTSWTTITATPSVPTDPGTSSNTLQQLTANYIAFVGGTQTYRYWRFSVQDTPFSWSANTRLELGTFRLSNGATAYTTSGGATSSISNISSIANITSISM